MIVKRRSGSLRIAGLLLLPLALACCGGDRAPPPPPPAPVAAAPSGPIAVDGTYQGNRQLVRGGDGPGMLCGQIDGFSTTVTNRRFHYVLNQPELPYQPTRAFDVAIDADGGFRATNGPAYINGNAGGGTMQGEVSGDACGYVFQADRQGP
jgi:hypothetical protein